MPRFSKGTMDHDGDGRRGGSMKGTGEMAKTPAKKPAPRKAPAPETSKAKAEATFAEADAKGKPETAEERAARELEEQRVGQQVRGY